MKTEIVTCDICGRNLNDVNSEAGSGYGNLKFFWTMGAYGGGCSDTVLLADMCVECTEKMRIAINQTIDENKNKFKA
jgi:hypothetical protein